MRLWYNPALVKNDIEIEVKVRAENPARLIQFLETKAKFIHELHQVDEYFNAPHRDFTTTRPVKEWLRLRSSGQVAVTYKLWHYDDAGNALYADEYETAIGDIATMHKIFHALNFAPLVTVEKTRRTWNYQDYEIALDRVKNLGDFIEIEYKGKPTTDPKTINDDMLTFLKDIDCGQIERSHQGYAMMLLHPDEMKLERV